MVTYLLGLDNKTSHLRRMARLYTISHIFSELNQVLKYRDFWQNMHRPLPQVQWRHTGVIA